MSFLPFGNCKLRISSKSIAKTLTIASSSIKKRKLFSPPEKNKTKLVVLGCGWGGYRLIKDIDLESYDLHVISPRNHFLFTPRKMNL